MVAESPGLKPETDNDDTREKLQNICQEYMDCEYRMEEGRHFSHYMDMFICEICKIIVCKLCRNYRTVHKEHRNHLKYVSLIWRPDSAE